MRRSILILIVIIISISGGMFAKEENCKIYGIVVLEDGSAIPGVEVSIKRIGSPKAEKTNLGSGEVITTITDEKGNYRFRYLKPGTYLLIFKMAGFPTQFDKVNLLQSGKMYQYNRVLYLYPPTKPFEKYGDVLGTVSMKDDSVIPGVIVSVVYGGGGGRTTVTNEKGAYRFFSLPVGEYDLTFEIVGWKTVKKEGVKVTGPDTQYINVVMEFLESEKPAEPISDIVIDEDRPVIIINSLRSGNDTVSDGHTVGSPEIDISMTAVDQIYGIERVEIQINGKTVIKEIEIGKKIYPMKKQITLTEKNNRVKIIAVNSKKLTGCSKEINLIYREDILKGKSLSELVRHFFGKTRSWAVLIGIDEYSKAVNGYKRLPYAVNDAKAVKQYLLKTMGLSEEKIFSLYNEDATREHIDTLLGVTLPAKVHEGDRVIVYFSGHGDQERIRRKRRFGYLVPIDGKKGKLYSTCISMKKVRTYSERNPAKQMLLVFSYQNGFFWQTILFKLKPEES